jgi:hypothetical protein
MMNQSQSAIFPGLKRNEFSINWRTHNKFEKVLKIWENNWYFSRLYKLFWTFQLSIMTLLFYSLNAEGCCIAQHIWVLGESTYSASVATFNLQTDGAMLNCIAGLFLQSGARQHTVKATDIKTEHNEKAHISHHRSKTQVESRVKISSLPCGYCEQGGGQMLQWLRQMWTNHLIKWTMYYSGKFCPNKRVNT